MDHRGSARDRRDRLARPWRDRRRRRTDRAWSARRAGWCEHLPVKARNHQPTEEGNRPMPELIEAGTVTGTADKDYNLIWFTEACLNNALRLETYIEDARR